MRLCPHPGELPGLLHTRKVHIILSEEFLRHPELLVWEFMRMKTRSLVYCTTSKRRRVICGC
jgi:hypothetical protein